MQQMPFNHYEMKNVGKHLKHEPQMIDPYYQETFKLSTINTQNQTEQFKQIKKVNEQNVYFDDNSLEFDCERPEFLDVKKITLANSQITEKGINKLCSSEYATGLTDINLSNNTYNIQDVILRLISNSPYLKNLESLNLNDTAISDWGIMYLFYPYSKAADIQESFKQFRQSKIMSKTVQREHTQGTQMSETQSSLASSKFQAVEKLPNFKRLSLCGNYTITDKSLECISFSLNMKLEYLDISFTKITSAGAKILFESPNSETLKYLDLSHQFIDDECIEVYSKSPYCKYLVVLKLRNCPISSEGVKWLTTTQNTQYLEELDLSIDEHFKTQCNKRRSDMNEKKYLMLSDSSLAHLSKSQFLGNLITLKLSSQPLTYLNLFTFIKSDTARHLETLYLNNNDNINDDFCQIVRDNIKSMNLKKLSLLYTKITKEGVLLLQDYVEVAHSVKNMPQMADIIQKQRAGIKLYVCDICDSSKGGDIASKLSITICINCRDRPIKTVEFPAKLCQGCGIGYRAGECYQCKTPVEKTRKNQLYRCYFCSIGNKKFECLLYTIELKEMRKTLHDFKKSGKLTVLSVLKMLDEQKIDPTYILIVFPRLIHDSKIHKTLLTLSKKDIALEVDAEFNEEDLLEIKQKCINLYKKFKSVQGTDSQQNSARKQSASSQRSEQSEKKVIQQTYQSLSIDEMIKKLNIPENFEPQRLKVLRYLIEKLSDNKQSKQIQQFTDLDFATLARKLENETFMKHKMSSQYQNTIKEMIKYFQQDEDGSVRIRFLSNIITPSEAIQLKSEHWVTPKKIQASLSLSKEQIEAGDMGHARRIAKSINKNSSLEKCPNCGELQLMLINEIQIRASDEPPARFFECIGCDHSEVRNG